MIDKIGIEIREINPLPRTNKSWLFLKHLIKEERNFDLRWGIGYRERDNWWGVICIFPATHERAIDRIKKEMVLAKRAIKILKRDLSLK